jgi:peroxiredoxin
MRMSLLLVGVVALLMLGCRSTRDNKENKTPDNTQPVANNENKDPEPKANEEVKDPTDPEFCLLPPEAQDDDLGGKLKVGEAAPDFTLANIQTGEDVKLSDYKGKTVLVFFWASWCPYCKAMCKKGGSLNVFAAEMEAAKDSNLVILGVGTSSDDSADTQNAFLKTNACNWTSTHDTGSKVEGKYGVLGVPTVVLLDGDGKVLTYGTFRDPYRTSLLDYLRQSCLKTE